MSVRAAVVSAPGTLTLEDFPEPELGPGEALMRMELSGICGTDKHVFKGEGTLYAGTMMETEAKFPVIPGHENVGVIEEIGSAARTELEFYGRPLAVGDRVVMCPDVVCGRCWWYRHSNWMGDSATRHGFTRTDGAFVTPASSNSSTSGGTSIAERLTASRRS